jgi:hypothetical protein
VVAAEEVLYIRRRALGADNTTATYRLEKNAHTPFDAKLGHTWPSLWTHQITGALEHW